MKPSKQAKKAALKLLKCSSPKSEQELIDEIATEDVSRKQVKKAIQKLLRKGEIVESDGFYYSLASRSEPDERAQHAEDEAVPFAEILRRRAVKQGSDDRDSHVENERQEEVDIDDEIRRLEAELAADDNESDDETEGASVDQSVERAKRVSFGKVSVKEIAPSPAESRSETGDVAVVCLSTVAQDRIAPLPESCLPKTKKRTLKGIDDDPQQKRPKKIKVNSGLRDAVKEVLSGYVARSSERLPFYCRVCAKQYTNEQEFFEHKGTGRQKSGAALCENVF